MDDEMRIVIGQDVMKCADYLVIFCEQNMPYIVLGCILLVEQVACFFSGAFPYLSGITVITKRVPISSSVKWRCLEGTTDQLSIYLRGDDVFIKIKYPPLTLGPCVYVATVNRFNDTYDVLRIKACPLLSVTAIMLLIWFVLVGNEYVNTFTGVCWVLFFSLVFVGNATCFYWYFSKRVFNLFDSHRLPPPQSSPTAPPPPATPPH